jgi:hypothetical protein
MVDKQGTEGVLDARQAYQASYENREISETESKISTALKGKVISFPSQIWCIHGLGRF